MVLRLLSLVAGSLLSSAVLAQCMLLPVSIKDRNHDAEAVVGAKVLNSYSTWDAAHGNILTIHELYIDQTFKGNNLPSIVLLATLGGTQGNIRQETTNELELHPGDYGIFWLYTGKYRSAQDPSLSLYRPYAGPQGFVQILGDGSAKDPFQQWPNEISLYDDLAKAGGLPSFQFTITTKGMHNAGAVPVISSISPDSVSAGTRSVVTIKGSSFGALKGSVKFKDANDGGASYYSGGLASEITFWNDTMIRVFVPSRAGTGTIQVTNSSGTATSSQSVVVLYSHLNVTLDNKAFLTRHVSKNGAGGYTWRMNDANFNDRDSAKKSFLRAFQNWRCNTFINWTIGDSTSVDSVASDGINVITFDNNDPLPNGVLGVCTSWWSGCFTGSDTLWFVNELDIVFDQQVNWNFGPGAPGGSQMDFESVALHELGHGHQAGHVNKSTEVMHYSIGPGQSKSTLSTFDIQGMQAVMTRNLSGGVCGNSTMTALNGTNCGLLPVANFTSNKTAVCKGSTVTFTDSSYGLSGSYNWNFGMGANPTTATGAGPHVVTYDTVGTATVSLTVTSSLGADTRTKNNLITINPPTPAAPTVLAGSSLVCSPNGNVFRVGKVPGASSYQWSVSTGGVLSSTNDSTATFNLPVKATPYTISVRAVNSCGNSGSLSMQVTSSAKVSSSFTGSVSADTIKLNSTSVGADSVAYRVGNQWFSGPIQTLIASGNGNYNVVHYAYSPCGPDSSNQNFLIAVGMNDRFVQENVNISPNPMKDYLEVYFPVLPATRNLQVNWMDMQGRVVSRYPVSYNQVLRLERGALATGAYLLRISAGNQLLLQSKVWIY